MKEVWELWVLSTLPQQNAHHHYLQNVSSGAFHNEPFQCSLILYCTDNHYNNSLVTCDNYIARFVV